MGGEAGRQEWRLDAKGQRTTYVYDNASRQTQMQYSDGRRVTYTFDNARQRTKMEDSVGVTTYSFDEVGRPKAVNYPPGKAITYTYDAVGNRAVMTDPDAGLTTYSFDSRNLLSSLANPSSERTTYQYDALGRVTTMTYGNTALAETDYDAAGRTTAVRNLKSDRSGLSIFTYTYDNVGDRTAVTEANGDRVTWSYDGSYQLTREQRSGANAYDVTYSYDPVGNRLTKLEGGTTTSYSYDAANQLNTEVTPSARTTYTYDANGNTQVINAAGSRTTYSWDVENMLIQAVLPDGSSTTFTYDGDKRRRSKGEGGALVRFVRDGERVLLETDSGGTTRARYTVQGGDWFDGLIAMRRGNASSFYHFDALGSADRLTDVNQATTDSYIQKAFGVPVASSGSTINPFRFVARCGYYRDPSTGLMQLGVRYYRDAMGRFASRDPILQGLNWYIYVDNRPLSADDPSGLASCEGGVTLQGQFVHNGKIRQLYRDVECIYTDDCLRTWREDSETDCDCNCKGTYYIAVRFLGYFTCTSMDYYYLTQSPAGIGVPGTRWNIVWFATWQECTGFWLPFKGRYQKGDFKECTCKCVKTVKSVTRIS